MIEALEGDCAQGNPASVHNPDLNLYSIFWPSKTPEQIAAFVRYTKWMVNRYRGRVYRKRQAGRICTREAE